MLEPTTELCKANVNMQYFDERVDTVSSRFDALPHTGSYQDWTLEDF